MQWYISFLYHYQEAIIILSIMLIQHEASKKASINLHIGGIDRVSDPKPFTHNNNNLMFQCSIQILNILITHRDTDNTHKKHTRL